MPILVNLLLLLKSTPVILASPEKAASAIVVKAVSFEKSTFCKLVSSAKACLPIVAKLADIVTDVKALLYVKALSPTLVTESGRSTVLIWSLTKAKSPIVVKSLSLVKSTFCKFEYPKAPVPIFVTPLLI